jgi:dihydrofolate reductase
MINIIAAIQEKDRGLGKNNDLLFHLPEDMAFFRTRTKNTVVIMGRKTWESLPEKFRPLPHRENIIITRQKDYDAPGGAVVHSLNEALDFAKNNFPDKEIFIMGGGQIYTEALPVADRLYLTLVEGDKEADIFFPAYEDRFTIVDKKERAQSSTGPSFQFVELTSM